VEKELIFSVPNDGVSGIAVGLQLSSNCDLHHPDWVEECDKSHVKLLCSNSQMDSPMRTESQMLASWVLATHLICSVQDEIHLEQIWWRKTDEKGAKCVSKLQMDHLCALVPPYEYRFTQSCP